MRHINYVLKPATIDNAKPKDKRYDLTDGGGLVLEVMPSGSKTWRFKYHLNRKREKVTIGAYPAFTIKQARDRHEELRALVERAKSGRLPIEDDRGAVREGREALRAIADHWRLGGTRIPEVSERREAFNIMLSMPTGTDARVVRQAAREFAKAELANHRYVMVLHTHQANPHVHISVRAEGRDGKRLNPRKEDLHRWRETFADNLGGWGSRPRPGRRRRGVSRGAACAAGSASPVPRPEAARSAASTSRGRRFGPRVPVRCRPGPRSPRHWRHRPTRPTASSARASSTS